MAKLTLLLLLLPTHMLRVMLAATAGGADAASTASAAAAAACYTAATTRVCADGGANRLHDAHLAASSSSASAQQQQQPHAAPAGGARTAGANNGSQALPQASGRGPALPTVVVGDLDSLRPDVRAHYEQLGVPVVDLSADQDSTDLTKCVRWIEQHAMADAAPSGRCGSSGGVNATSTSTSSSTSSRDGGGQQDAPAGTGRHVILALGALGGRLDHTLGNLNTLHLFPHLDITLWGQGNLARLVRPGRAAIRPAAGLEGPFCGLAPLAQPATASSRGLRWNLAATRMAFGGLISTSNRLEAGEVWVETDQPLVWTTQVDDAAV